MSFNFIVKTAQISTSNRGQAYSNPESSCIKFDCEYPFREYIHIGEDYILTNPDYEKFDDGNREPVDLDVSVYPVAKKTPKSKTYKDRVNFRFWDKRGEQGDENYSHPFVSVNIFLEDESFIKLCQNIHNNSCPNLIRADNFEGKNAIHFDIKFLDFGWEPDGSSLKWDISNKKNFAFFQDNVQFEYPLTQAKILAYDYLSSGADTREDEKFDATEKIKNMNELFKILKFGIPIMTVSLFIIALKYL